jgi:hypothetical protein
MKKIKRDEYSNGIINVDQVGYQSARLRKIRNLNQQERINKIENDLTEVKELLYKLVSNNEK